MLRRRPSALVIDDYPDTCDLYMIAFADGGFDVAVAGGMEEAARLLTIRRPDVVVVDAKADGDFAALVDTLRRCEAADDIAIVVVGADVHHAGPVDHTLTAVTMPKPCLPDALVLQAQAMIGMTAGPPAADVITAPADVTLWKHDDLCCTYRGRRGVDAAGSLRIHRGRRVIWQELAASAPEAMARADSLRLLAKRGVL